MFEVICAKLSHCSEKTLEPLLELAIEIAREGREGRRIGTLFTIGDADAVMAWSRPLILNPFEGHPANRRHIASANLWGTVKELAQLDGAFVVSDEGVFVAAGRYLDANASDIDVPFGLGSRHIAAHDFFRGLFETALNPGEIVTAISLPAGPPDGRAAYEKLSLVAGDFAIISVAAIVDRTARIAIGGCGATPLLASGLQPTDAALRDAAHKLAAESDPPSDHRASAAYRRKVLPELVCRAVRAARS